MRAIFDVMSLTDGVITAGTARELGLHWEVEERLVNEGIIERAAPGVLCATSAARTWRQRVRIATLAPGEAVASHGTAARLHELDGFDQYPEVDILCRKGWWPNCPDGTITHFTRGPVPDDVVDVDGIRVLSVGATLALLPQSERLGAVAKALDSALRAGRSIEELRTVAVRWSRRGRRGPALLRMLLDEREGKTLPASWFQRLAKPMVESLGVRFVDEWEVRNDRGELLARLDLAVPELRIGVECQSWRWHATPEAQHRDARRRGMLREMGWEIVDVWWRDLSAPDRVRKEVAHLIRLRRAELSASSRPRDGSRQTER